MKVPEDINSDRINSRLGNIRSSELLPASPDNLKLMFSIIDLTSLNTQDTGMQIETMCKRVNNFPEYFPGLNKFNFFNIKIKQIAPIGKNKKTKYLNFQNSEKIPRFSQTNKNTMRTDPIPIMHR